jgi:CheY-like chemotaxis protein
VHVSHRILNGTSIASWTGSAVLIAQGAARTAVEGIGSSGVAVTIGGIATAFFPLLFAYLNKKLEVESRTRDLERDNADLRVKLGDANVRLDEANARIGALERASKAVPENTARIAANDGKASVALEKSRDGPARGRILLVEDDPLNCQFFSAHLARRDYEVQHVPTVTEAIAFLDDQAQPFLAIVLDLGLPDGDGTVVVDYCEANRRRAKIVIVTGSVNEERAHALLDRGVVAAVLKKPVHRIEDLLGAIEG